MVNLVPRILRFPPFARRSFVGQQLFHFVLGNGGNAPESIAKLR